MMTKTSVHFKRVMKVMEKMQGLLPARVLLHPCLLVEISTYVQAGLGGGCDGQLGERTNQSTVEIWLVLCLCLQCQGRSSVTVFGSLFFRASPNSPAPGSQGRKIVAKALQTICM